METSPLRCGVCQCIFLVEPGAQTLPIHQVKGSPEIRCSGSETDGEPAPEATC
jgi:hypothetical protein